MNFYAIKSSTFTTIGAPKMSPIKTKVSLWGEGLPKGRRIQVAEGGMPRFNIGGRARPHPLSILGGLRARASESTILPPDICYPPKKFPK